MQTRRSSRRGAARAASTPNPPSGSWVGPGIPLGGRGASGNARPATVGAEAGLFDFGSDDEDILLASPIELPTPNNSSTPVVSRPRRGRRPSTAAATPTLRDLPDTAPILPGAGVRLGGRGETPVADFNIANLSTFPPAEVTPKRQPKKSLPPSSSRTRSGGALNLAGTSFIPASALLSNGHQITPPHPNTSPAFTDTSVVNESFLCAVDNLEKQIDNDNTKSSSISKGGGTKRNAGKGEKENHVSFLFPDEKTEHTNLVNNAPPADSQDMFDDSCNDEMLNMLAMEKEAEMSRNTSMASTSRALNSSRTGNVSGSNGRVTYGVTTRKRKQSGPLGVEPQKSPIFMGSLMDLNIPDPRLRLEPEEDMEVGEPETKKTQYGVMNAPSAANAVVENGGCGPKPLSRSTRNKKDKGDKGKKKKKGKFQTAYTNRKSARILSSGGNNELSQAELSNLSEEGKLLLINWGLPHSVVEKYRSKGVTSLFPWQLECLSKESVLSGQNLVYSAPTSAGKTLVAEILMAKRVLELGKKAIMILPFVSVCREKMYGLQEIFGGAGIRVEGFMGSYSPPGGFQAVDIAICTIEKANSLINRLLEDNELSQLGTVVVDELHLIGDPSRGYLLELLLTKIRFMTEHPRTMNDSIASTNGTQGIDTKKLSIQVIGMSATLPNLELLTSWLNAELVTTDFRPVPLVEKVCHNGKLYNNELQFVRDVKLPELPVQIMHDNDSIVYLSLETVLNGHSVLIFCRTKKECENLAQKISNEFCRLGDPRNTSMSPETKVVADNLRKQLTGAHLQEVLTHLEQSPAGVDDVLKDVVRFGVAFHHAGLTYDERDIIEASFKRCVIRVIVATSTLSAGVNLPARRVIVSSPLSPIGTSSLMDVMTYRQMCGRAGRKGIDTEGESILICTDITRNRGAELVQASLPRVKSALLGNDGVLTSSLKRALLEVIASGIVTQPSDLDKYSNCTLFSKSIEDSAKGVSISTSHESKDKKIQDALKFLIANDFVRERPCEAPKLGIKYTATQLGSACLASSLAPDEGITVYEELLKARDCFVLSSDLHIIYQVTPIFLSDGFYADQYRYLELYNDLEEEEKRVGKLIGVDEGSLVSRINRVPSKKQGMIQLRFYAALALNELVNEKSISYVADKYDLNKGVLQNLQQSASTFAGMVTAFCSRLKWRNLELLLSQFQERFEFGIQRELCDLVRLSTMNAQRARVLYDNDIKTVADLAASDPTMIETILHSAAPFISTVHGEGGSGPARPIWMLGKTEGLSEIEASKKIVEEARQFIQIELKTNIDFDLNAIKRPGSRPQENSKLKLEPLHQDESSSDSETDFEETDDAPVTKTALNSGSSNANPTNLLETSLRNADNVSRKQVNYNNNQPLGDESGNDDVFTADVRTSTANQNQEQLMDIQGMLKQLVETSMDISDGAVGNKENVATPPNSSRTERVEEILHSTPGKKAFLTSNVFVKHRLSSIAFDTHGPGSPVAVAQKPQKISTSTPKNYSENEINSELLAELSKDFDSVAELMEISLNISEINPNHDEAVPPVPLRDQFEQPNPQHHKLSESDAAAALAIANDSKFDSEDLFADFDNHPVSSFAVTAATTGHSSKDLFDDEETQFPELLPLNELGNEDIAPSIPSTSNYRPTVPEEYKSFQRPSSNMTHGSEMETTEEESNFSILETSADASSLCESSPPLPLAIIDFGDGRKLTAKKIATPDLLPEEMFSSGSIIGLGFQLTCPAQPLSTGGIGSKIIALKNPRPKVEYSIVLYKGGHGTEDSIWIYSWIHAPPVEEELDASNKRRLTRLFEKLQSSGCTIVIFDAKDKIKKLLDKTRHPSLLTNFPTGIIDPKMAHWMKSCVAEKKDKSKNIKPQDDLYSCPDNKAITGLGNKLKNPAISEAFKAWNVMQKLIPLLEVEGVWSQFNEIEMPSIIPLLLMECNGFGLDSVELCRIKRVFEFKSAVLELHAYKLAGKPFNLSYSSDVGKILFGVLGLKQPPGTSGTGQEVLLKLDHDIAKIIMDWRKVKTSTLEKDLITLQNQKSLQSQRVHGCYCYFNVSGRVTTSENLNLQGVQKNFDLIWEYTPKEIQNIINYWKKPNSSPHVLSLIKQIEEMSKHHPDQFELLQVRNLSVRKTLVPCNKEFILVAVDYSQLELRMMAHLSQDPGLKDALNGKGGEDVFKSITARWKKLPYSEITDSMRSETKQLVYGLNYGMGSKKMAETLGVSKEEAKKYITDFFQSYPRLKNYIQETKDACRKNTYVATMSGRRREFPSINSSNHKQSEKAGRAAFNYKIQGSASELMKTAMNKVHAKLTELYPTNAIPVNWVEYLENGKSSPGSPIPTANLPPEVVCFPVQNMHDELIFEVRKTHRIRISGLIRDEMENAVVLNGVPTPVVIKYGDSWGTLTESGY